ncbi:MAG: NAD(P)-dependent oxidoreductase, partial [Vicinamibacterales bacterium]
ILGIARRVVEGDRLLRSGGWGGWALDFLLGAELRGKQLGIIGAGRIGRAVAARAPAFGMRAVFAKHDMPLDQLLVTSDVVSLHARATPEMRHLMNRKTLARMKRSAFLVNTSRGSLVDEAALAWALGERLIAGAALDVYEDEPRVSAALLARDDVILAPHIGSATRETRTAMAELAVTNVLRVLAGDHPLTPVS